MADYLELVLPIVDADSRATPYFEDYLYKIIAGLGGEGSTIIEDAAVIAEAAQGYTWLSGYTKRLAKRVEQLEGDLTHYKTAHQVAQLQIATAGYVCKTVSQNYTASHNEWIESLSSADITLPSNSLKNNRVRVSNGDNTKKKVRAGSGEKIKIRGKLEDCAIINTAGNSYDFQWFGEYWRIA